MPIFFLNASIFVAAAAVAIPVVIHLLYRRAPKEDSLPTMRFLKAAFKANRRRMRLKNLLVLFLRVLAVLLIVATIARPGYRGAILDRQGTAPVSAVVVMDNSVSMAYREATGAAGAAGATGAGAGATRFERAKALAGGVIDSLPAGSRVALVVTGLGRRGESLDVEFTYNMATVAKAIETLDVSPYGGDCVKALARAYSRLGQGGNASGETGGAGAGAGTGELGGAEVYVISDLAGHAWRGLAGLSAPEGTSTVVLDAGGAVDENFYVASVSCEAGMTGAGAAGAAGATGAAGAAAAGGRVKVNAAFASGGLAAKRLVEMNLLGAKRAERIVDLPRRAREAAEFDTALIERPGGPLQGWVSLADPDPIAEDNARYFTVGAARKLSCLITTGEGPARQGSAPWFYIRNALEPATMRGKTGVSADYLDASKASPEALASADVVIVSGLAGIGEDLAATIEGFAAAGKGVVVFVGAEARPEGYERFLAKTFNLSLGPVERARADRPAALSVISYDHPMLAGFAGGKNGDLSAARFYQWRKLVAPVSPVSPAGTAEAAGGAGAEVVARIGGERGDERDRGDPAIVVARAGKGRMVLAAFSPARNETDFALHASFVPLLHEMAAYARGGGAAAQARADYPVGAAVAFHVERSSAARAARVTTPLGEKPVEISIPPGASGFLYRPYFPGNYAAVIPAADPADSPVETAFSANIAPEESVLDRVGAEEITGGLPGAVVAGGVSEKTVRREWGRTRGTRELFDLFLVLAVAALAVECFVANRFYKKAGSQGRP